MLLCTSNGAGLGHVTRMMAVAEQLTPAVDPVLFTLSAALPIPVEAGLRVEHLPSAGYVDVPVPKWHDLLEDRVEQLIIDYRPSVVVFDGVHPYRGLTNALTRRRRRFTTVWLRRGMWKPGVGDAAVELARYFDEVIEPGEYAASHDRGAPSLDRSAVHQVAPMCYRGPGTAVDRAGACHELGLDPTDVNVLVQLGAGTINDVASMTGVVVAELREQGARSCVARSELSAGEADHAPDVTIVQRFPISRWFPAFDLGVIAAGYNSFHEAMSCALPTIVVPNLSTKTDDQDARSRWADEHGYAVRWDGENTADLRTAVGALCDAAGRSAMQGRLGTLAPAHGAAQVASLVRSWMR